jgi:diguanylate cyclase (GGDEF)-like protein
MARFRFIPEDANQALRIRRYLIASATTLLVVLLFCVCYLAGLMPAWLLAGGVGFAAFRVALFYALFRTELNQRFADPSLTTEQILLATLNVAFVMFFAEGTRGALLPVYVVPFLFGVFRLRTRQFFVLGLVVLLVFGAMQFLSVRLGYAHADGVRDLVELAVVAVVVPWFSVFGGYVNSLRAELGASNRKLKSALERIEQLAIHDELTGSYNRHYLMESLRQEKARFDRGGAKFAVCLFDLDRFKEVNDSFGHAAGDAVLKHFAAIAAKTIRQTDVFGRYGGEEFLLALPQSSLEAARLSAERIRGDLERSACAALPAGQPITVSVGVAAIAVGEDLLALLARADKGLYEGKAAGRNRVVAVG